LDAALLQHFLRQTPCLLFFSLFLALLRAMPFLILRLFGFLILGLLGVFDHGFELQVLESFHAAAPFLLLLLKICVTILHNIGTRSLTLGIAEATRHKRFSMFQLPKS